MIRTRMKVGLVAAVVAAGSALTMAPAQAGPACHPDPLGPDFEGEEQICHIVLGLICAPFEKFGGCPIR